MLKDYESQKLLGKVASFKNSPLPFSYTPWPKLFFAIQKALGPLDSDREENGLACLATLLLQREACR